MQATSEQIISLIKLQHIDLTIAQIEREVESLPQKKALAELVEKRGAIQRKQRALVGGRKDLELRLESLREERDELDKKAAEAQGRIEASADDYREVSSNSDALQALAEERQAIDEKISSVESDIIDLSDLEPQVETMLSRLAERERELIAQYRESAGELISKAAPLKEERASLIDGIGSDIMSRYDRIAKAKQGVALAHLHDGACNTCRASIDPSRVLALRSEYPLSFCPHCGRLMVIDKPYAG